MLESTTYKEKSNLKYWIIGIVYLLVVASFLFFVFPQIQEAKRIQQAIDRELDEQRLLRAFINRKGEFEELLANNSQLVKEYEQLIPPSYDLPVVLLSIHRLADLVGLKIDSLQYSSMQQANNVYWYPITLQSKGKYTSIYRFMQAFSTHLPTARARNVRLRSVSSQEISFNCEFSLYTIPNHFEIEYRWQSPEWRLFSDVIRNVVGVPLSDLQAFYNGGLTLLGIVSTSDGKGQRALIRFQGKEEWKTVGSYVGIGRITRIQSESVTLDINGFTITISMGG